MLAQGHAGIEECGYRDVIGAGYPVGSCEGQMICPKTQA